MAKLSLIFSLASMMVLASSASFDFIPSFARNINYASRIGQFNLDLKDDRIYKSFLSRMQPATGAPAPQQPQANGTPIQNAIESFARRLSLSNSRRTTGAPSGATSGAASGASSGGSSGSNASPYLAAAQPYISAAANGLNALRSTGSGSATFWDLMSVFGDFAFTIQQPILNLGFDVAKEVKAQSNDLKWSSLPSAVRTTLLNEKQTGQLFNMTFCQLSLVESSSSFCNKNLYSIVPSCIQPVLTAAIAALSPFNFDTTFNSTAFQSTFNWLTSTLPAGYVPNSLSTFNRTQQLTELRSALNNNRLPTKAQVHAELDKQSSEFAQMCPTSHSG